MFGKGARVKMPAQQPLKYQFWPGDKNRKTIAYTQVKINNCVVSGHKCANNGEKYPKNFTFAQSEPMLSFKASE